MLARLLITLAQSDQKLHQSAAVLKACKPVSSTHMSIVFSNCVTQVAKKAFMSKQEEGGWKVEGG